MPTPAPETTTTTTTTGSLRLLSSTRQVHHSLNYALCLRLLRNTTFLIVSVITLFSIPRLKSKLSRFSIRGYSFQFVGHLGLLRLEFRNRNSINLMENIFFRDVSSFANYGDDSVTFRVSTQTRVSRRWDKVISGIWWVIGSIWTVFGSENLNDVAPRLFWLTLAFFTIDTFFAFIQYLLAVFRGGAVSFCFPCIFGIMYFWRLKEGASDADINNIPKYIVEVTNDDGKMVPMGTNSPEFSVERVLLIKDAECCICLCHYENGEQLHLLPCNHNFHAECIVKWLKLKGICPLCRYVIG